MDSKKKQLSDAAIFRKVDIVKRLLLEGDNVDYCDSFGISLCSWAILHGHNDVMKILLARGANVNAATSDGWTLLHWAIVYGKLDTVKLLVSHGALFDNRNKYGETPRDWAIRREDKEVVAYLDALTRTRSAACYLIGIRKGRGGAHLKPLPKEGMGDLGIFPKEIVVMIARWVWTTRDDPIWQDDESTTP